MTEYLYRDNNELKQEKGKQDSETTAFKRLAKRLKQYFPCLSMIFFMDAMYATQPVMGTLDEYHWEYIIRLPKRKLTDFAALLMLRLHHKLRKTQRHYMYHNLFHKYEIDEDNHYPNYKQFE